jgi:hypothetical protein
VRALRAGVIWSGRANGSVLARTQTPTLSGQRSECDKAMRMQCVCMFGVVGSVLVVTACHIMPTIDKSP